MSRNPQPESRAATGHSEPAGASASFAGTRLPPRPRSRSRMRMHPCSSQPPSSSRLVLATGSSRASGGSTQAELMAEATPVEWARVAQELGYRAARQLGNRTEDCSRRSRRASPRKGHHVCRGQQRELAHPASWRGLGRYRGKTCETRVGLSSNAAADGVARGEGCGVLVLEPTEVRLDLAIEAGPSTSSGRAFGGGQIRTELLGIAARTVAGGITLNPPAFS